MSIRTYLVTFYDHSGDRRSVEVEAASSVVARRMFAAFLIVGLKCVEG